MSAAQAFTVSQTHGILSRPSTDVRAASDTWGLSTLYASVQQESPYEDAFPAVEDHLMILHLDGPVTVERSVDGSTQACRIGPGGVFIMPGGVDFGVCLGGDLNTVHVYLRKALVDEVAADMVSGDPSRLEFLPRFGNVDPIMARLMLGVQDVLTDRMPADAACLDHLGHTIAARFVALCSPSARPAPAPRPDAKLGRRQVQDAIDFMRAHLEEPIDLGAIAGAANLSASHFARRFRATVGLAPHQYLMRLRIERAQWLLTATDWSIADVAAASGFSHQEHMARVFKRHCRTTPAAYRRGFRT